ncbi:MAG: adenylate/guanylate cyclase domain-containing protein [Gammaproteobacteria bacterium]|nr:adenylate/guanylate cyclase domain-containing protein [Gammaproteobacteria bacterium]
MSEPSTRLVVVMFTDLVGSVETKQRLGVAAYGEFIARHDQLFLEILKDIPGAELVQDTGDGFYALFPTSASAVEAALRFQHGLQAEDWPGPAPAVRIGLHMGQITEVTGSGQERKRVGMPIDLAARVMGLATGGQILVTRTVFDDARQYVRAHPPVDGDTPPLVWLAHGLYHLKGSDGPLEVFEIGAEGIAPLKAPPDNDKARRVGGQPASEQAIPGGTAGVPPGTAATNRGPARTRPVWKRLIVPTAVLALLASAAFFWWPTYEMAPDREAQRSIAVMPFANLNRDPDQEYFADAIADDLITDLSKLSHLRVIARSSSFAYKGAALDLAKIASELHVRYVLEGSVRRDTDHLRVNTQLVDTTSQQPVWAERYDGRPEDVFSLQDTVVRAVVQALSVELRGDEDKRIGRAASSNFKAYDLFLRGQQHYLARNQVDNEQARDLFRQAIALDPDFGRAYGVLALSYVQMASRGWGPNAAESLDRALELAQRAVELDDASPHVNWSLAYVHMYRREYPQALESARRAVEISPSYADGYGLLAFINNWMGNGADALRLIHKAMDLNPHYSFDYPWNEGFALFNLGRYEEAIGPLQEALDRNNSALFTHLVRASALVRLDRISDAEWEINEALALDPEYTLASVRSGLPIGKPELLAALVRDLRTAGLPE